MISTPTVWKIDEVSEEARKSAIKAAEDERVSLGAWLAQVINEAATQAEEKSSQVNHNLTSIERAMLRTAHNQRK